MHDHLPRIAKVANHCASEPDALPREEDADESLGEHGRPKPVDVARSDVGAEGGQFARVATCEECSEIPLSL